MFTRAEIMRVSDAECIIENLIKSRVKIDFDSLLIHVEGFASIKMFEEILVDESRIKGHNVYMVRFDDLCGNCIKFRYTHDMRMVEETIKSAVAHSFVKKERFLMDFCLDVLAKGLSIGGGRNALEGYDHLGDKL